MARMRVGLIGAIAVLLACALGTGTAAAQEGEFVKTQLVDTTLNPMEIEVAPDGSVFYTERRGVIGVWDPATESAREIGTVPVTYPSGENGLMGIALDPDYASNGWIYLAYSAPPAAIAHPARLALPARPGRRPRPRLRGADLRVDPPARAR